MTKTRLKQIAASLKVTNFSDYQTFLRLIYAQAKKEDASYSFVKFSEDLGIGSTNAHSIINNKRPLTQKAADKFCKTLGIIKAERKYFFALVDQERAKDHSQRDEAFQKRLQIKSQVLPNELDKRQLAFFEQWYHAAILEVLRLEHAESTAEWISSQLRPAVSKQKVAESLELLESLGYIKHCGERNRLYPTDATITTDNEVMGLAVMSFHRQMVKLALDAVETFPRDERDISAITVQASPKLVKAFKEEIIALRKKLLQMSAEEQEASEVMQINFQMFPLIQSNKNN